MKIAINTLSINNGMTGIGSYTKALMDATTKLPNHSFVYLVSSRMQIPQARDNVHYMVIDKFNFYWEQLNMPTELKYWEINYYHSPLFTCPIVDEFPSIITIHDVIPIVAPHLCSPQFLAFFEAHISHATRSAYKIVTTSNYSKQEIINHLHIPAEKITVIYQGISNEFFPRKEPEIYAIKTKYQLPQEYCLYVGMLEPRKNIEKMLLAIHKLITSGSSIRLVLAGRKDDENYNIEEMIEKLHLQNVVTLLGYVDQQDLPTLYSGAKMFIFPSLYEGFGRPIVEAMASGTAVASSNTSSLPEIAQDAAIYFDPHNVDDIAEVTKKLWENRGLRETLICAGNNRASLFSNDKFTERLAKFYEEL